MASIESRLKALEKLIADRLPPEPVQVLVLDIERDAPDEYERKRRQIEAMEAMGKKVIVFNVVDSSVSPD